MAEPELLAKRLKVSLSLKKNDQPMGLSASPEHTSNLVG